MRSLTVCIALLLASTATASAATDFIALGHLKGKWFNAELVGRTRSGDSFAVKADGTGKISGASSAAEFYDVRCHVDAMTDAKICTIDWWPTPGVIFEFDGAGKVRRICVDNTSLMIGSAQFRIGTQKPFVAGAGQCMTPSQAAMTMAQLKPGAQVRQRTMHLTDGGQRAIDLSGFVRPSLSVAIDLARFLSSPQYQRIPWPKQR